MTTLDTSVVDLMEMSSRPGTGLSRAPNRSPEPFNVVLLYEDFATARPAAIAAVRLADGLIPGCQVTHSWWRFSLLDNPRWYAGALAEAGGADAVIVSSRSVALPPSVNALLDDCLARASCPGFITILLSGTEDSWTISIRHARDFQAWDRDNPSGTDRTFVCGRRPALRDGRCV